MKKIIICLIWLIISIVPLRAAAEDEINHLLDESWQLVKQQEYDKARQILLYASQQQIHAKLPQHVQVISTAYNKAIETMGDVVSPQEVESDMLALRLVIDAESSHFQPLWLSRETAVMSAFDRIEQANKDENAESFRTAINDFLYEMNIIYPSLLVDLPKGEVQRLDKHFVYLEHAKTVMANESSKQQLSAIKHDVQQVFQYPKADVLAGSTIWVMITTGLIIIATLTYVGFRKYKGEQEKKRRKSKNG
ncbi:sporulation protein YpjB [Ectobacillus sp. JY-23]|uniref:sporulation protein YpjB n=1 Tax=Ectobacillus sp. JY-23 TaxID=2933872 RepID=UPI001FF10C87|nr:sporulation protein YpjB [Ectobacillus sp. JY-23]UOY93456.1 sporulation protein YpjB [Ectobacillus sp. JY-23]